MLSACGLNTGPSLDWPFQVRVRNETTLNIDVSLTVRRLGSTGGFATDAGIAPERTFVFDAVPAQSSATIDSDRVQFTEMEVDAVVRHDRRTLTFTGMRSTGDGYRSAGLGFTFYEDQRATIGWR